MLAGNAQGLLSLWGQQAIRLLCKILAEAVDGSFGAASLENQNDGVQVVQEGLSSFK